MQLIQLILTLATFLLTVKCQVQNTTQQYRLKTELKPNQPGKERYGNLYLAGYHIAAGLSDAVLLSDQSAGITGFLNGTNGQVNEITYQNQVFDLGNDFAWTLLPVPSVNFYAAWQPVRVQAGDGPSDLQSDSGFWIDNENGLQWTSAPQDAPGSGSDAFGGWLVCNWWHGVPQLFFRISNEEALAPCSCADVWLCPEYI
ncbi:hypothetical protein LTR37_003339 [Vermiconidia calcicola]|uniref:Uncharacterized protein n=1 Tax=Vermiconidia calcicola TaxID=1690605 RepID=A0ACC3NSS1_9PEZI|nr:hypothetical protein LTR37_003339 [Vermiconidia calcicola]